MIHWTRGIFSFITIGIVYGEFESLRQCEPIRIDMCTGIGYNETSMPNLVGHELQVDVEFTLQTFAPLIDYVCSTQLKLFLCATYVPLCTPKVPVPIGPCRSLCESVRMRCHPVLQGFGFPWPPALDCARFPKENNNETMCMEGPGEGQNTIQEQETYPRVPTGKPPLSSDIFECADPSNAHKYVKLYRSGRCAPLCDADILFEQYDKNLAESWVSAWTYATVVFGALALLCILLSDDSKNKKNRRIWSRILTPFVWCHLMVSLGWTVRFVAGRKSTACGYDPQLPQVSLLLIDGLSNAPCVATFLLRYYFLMASCVWWAILCLAWHRDVRRISSDIIENGWFKNTSTQSYDPVAPNRAVSGDSKHNADWSIIESNMACFAAWGLPAFQTAAVVIVRLVDADELLGACFVGNQSDKGLQILVATPLFCYWIFGSMNLYSGYFVHHRNKKFLENIKSLIYKHQVQAKIDNNDIGTFLFIYSVPCALLLLAVIYEFANIDVWLNSPLYVNASIKLKTPLWPFLTRAFMELMLGIICFAWVLGPKISVMCKQQLSTNKTKTTSNTSTRGRNTVSAYSTMSYQTVRSNAPVRSQYRSNSGITMNELTNYSAFESRSKKIYPATNLQVKCHNYNPSQVSRCSNGNETIL